MPRFAFVVEQGLGHRVLYRTLRKALAARPDVSPVWLPVELASEDVWERVLGPDGNWSLKGSLRARALLREARAADRIDAAFVHTQTVALFARAFMQRVPTVVSIDATPLAFDRLAGPYGHTVHAPWIERAKRVWTRATFRDAAAVVAMSAWAKDSVVDDYGIDAAKVTVIPPSVDTEEWRPDASARGGKVRILFVGGDLARKGGDLLLRWAKETRATNWELHLVTRSEVPTGGGDVFVHRHDAGPELVRLAQRCDVFALPTRGDCSPLACAEAMAAGLPVVTTTVGGVPELVRDGEEGYVTAPGDYDALRERLERLIALPDARASMGEKARARAVARFDARRNVATLLLLMQQARRRRAAARDWLTTPAR